MVSNDTVIVLQAIVSGVLGFLGVGIGVGVFKATINTAMKDIACLKRRQANLRGEDNGGIPKFMLRNDCITLRQSCGNTLQKQDGAIKALDNFARWWMQEKGLHIEDINKILNP